MKKQYYYHITDENWGNHIVLNPRKDGDNRDPKEPLTSRICVCPTIEGCLIAIYLQDMRTINVYRTEKEVLAENPYQVLDAHITGEKWLTKPTKFIYIGNLDKTLIDPESNIGIEHDWHEYDCYTFGCLGDGGKESQKWQTKHKKIFRNILENYWV